MSASPIFERDLKEGEIVTDEKTGKYYRAKKSVFPSSLISGPHGLGDPNDRTLRRIEVETLIPQLMNEQIEKVECRDFLNKFAECMIKYKKRWTAGRCSPFKDEFLRCKYAKVKDINFRAKITEEYLKRRTEYRKSGVDDKQRKVNEYLKWKHEHQVT